MTKQAPCCARWAGKVTVAENDLRTFARRAAFAAQKAQPMGRWKLRIENAKVAVEQAKHYQAEHEAEHAGSPE